MKFAFLIQGEFDYPADRCSIHQGTAQIIGVADLSQACQAAEQLCREGVDCIELCGAFGPQGAEAVIQATQGRVPVGYVTHLPQQDALYRRVFGAGEGEE